MPPTVGASTTARLVWNIDSLLASQSATFRIQCTCQTASAKAYHYVTVSLPDGGRVEGNAFVEILKAADRPVRRSAAVRRRRPAKGCRCRPWG